MGLLLLVCFADLSAVLTVIEPGQQLEFGPYHVEVVGSPPVEERLVVRDRAGRIVYQLSDAHFQISLLDVTGDGVPELRVVHDPGGSCCSGTERFFTRQGGFRELFAVDRGRGEGLTRIRDLDGDGRPELVFEITLWASEYIACTSNPGCRLDRVVVVGWDGIGYADQTRRFPQLSRQQALRYRQVLGEEDLHRQHALAGYYGNAILAGDEAGARRWIEKWAGGADVSDDDRDWLATYGERVREEFLADPLSAPR
jgi:hypothetical protein